MIAQAKPSIALRPMLPGDAPALAALFAASIDALTADDYDAGQRAAWIAAAGDVPSFGRRLDESLTLVGSVGGAIAGFASLKGTAQIDMLYCHPRAAGQGIATALCDALEKLAQARQATILTVDASDTAQGFFARRGYVAKLRKTVPLGDEWLGTTTMEKRLEGAGRLEAN